MNILELGSLNIETIFTYQAPFTVKFLPGVHTTADYWINTFGAPDESVTDKEYIAGFVRGAFTDYAEVTSVVDCINNERSFFWDHPDQEGYAHLEHEYYYDYLNYSYETYFIFPKGKLIYIDDQECLPFLKSVPNIRQQQDITNYDRFSFVTGKAVLNNVGGDLDYFNDINIYGNNAFNSYVDDEDITEVAPGVYTVDRADIQRLQAFYIENYDVSVTEVTVSLQDKRKAQDVLICTDLFTETEYPDINEDLKNQPIPILYGEIRECEAIPIDSDINDDVTFRIAFEMTDIGTIQVNIDDVWTTVTPNSTDVANGEFVLDETDCRDANGGLYETRSLSPIGPVNTYSSDVIVQLNEKYIFAAFNNSFYDTAEWASEETVLSEIGVMFTEQIKLFEAIEKIQSGSVVGFRYEINSEGQRTIRIDDNDRTKLGYLHNSNIRNMLELPVGTRIKQVYAKIDVEYAKSYLTDIMQLEQNNDYEDQVGAKYRRNNTLKRPTLLINQADAISRAASDADRFKDVPKVISLTIVTPTKADRLFFQHLRIYDVLYAELTPAEFVCAETGEIDGREFYGLKYIKIVSINPVVDKNVQNITAQILTDRTELIYNHYDFSRHGVFVQDHYDFSRTSGQDHYDFTRS